MNFRHCAALALVVWHLMYPNRAIRVGVTYDSPLSEWDFNDEGFKSKKDCEQQADSDRRYWANLTKDGDYSAVTMLIAPYVGALLKRKAVCVRSDDPRLKGN